MKRTVTALAALVLATAFAGAAETKIKGIDLDKPRVRNASGSALGLFVGQPTGITYRQGVSKTNSLEFKAAWDLVDSSKDAAAFGFQANWLLEFPGTIIIEDADIPPYVGIGLSVGVGSGGVALGFRVPVGLVHRFPKAPLELGLEVGLGMLLFPATSFDVDGGLALRYRF